MDSLPVNCRPFLKWRVCSAGFLGILAALLVASCSSSRGAALMDNFADRQVLSDSETNIAGSNVGATRESGEPQHAGKAGGTSLWVSWVAPTNGIVTFRTAGSDFDTLLAAYYFRDGDEQTLDKLREAASNDDDPGSEPASYIQFATKAGRRYEIAVDGFHGATGAVALAWDFIDINTQPPIVVSVPGDRAVRLGDPVTLTVNFETSPDARLQWRFNGDSFGEEGPTLFIPSLQLTNVGRYSLRVRIGDNRFETTPVEIQINSEGQTNALARDKYFDALDSRLTPGNDDDAPAGVAPLIVAASGAPVAGNSGVTRGYNGTQIFNTAYATPDPNEPQHCGVAGGASYWFAYEAPTNGMLHVDTIGSGFDTVLAAYGVQQPPSGFESLIPLTCDNDAVAPQGESRIELLVAAGEQYLIVVDGVAGAKGIAHLNYQLAVAPPPDVIPPSLTITSPSGAALTASTASLTITGTAADNVGVSNIFVHTPSATTVAVLSVTNEWSVTLDLAAGTNIFYFTAFDAAGNSSETLGRSIYYRVASPLTLRVEGDGKVTGATDGESLEIGRQYLLNAKPGRGYVFHSWSGPTNVATTPLRFVMVSNATLTANFIPNPFIPIAGAYNAVFTNPTAVDTFGWFRLTLRSSGAFSGSIQQANRRLPFAGRFDVTGRTSIYVRRPGSNALFLSLQLALPEGEELRGTFNFWPLDFTARRASFHRRINPATNFAGRYTVLLPGSADTAAAPIGDGFATITIATSGSLNAAGVLADGTAFTQSVPLSSDGGWPLFAALYHGKGLLAGNLRVRPPVDEGNDIEGFASWLRLAGVPSITHTNGFLLESAVIGSLYARPVTERLLDTSLAALTLTDAAGATVLTNLVAFGPGGRLTNGGPHHLTLSASAKTGLLRGSIILPDEIRPTLFRGAVLQRQVIGGGYFHGSNTIGRIDLAP